MLIRASSGKKEPKKEAHDVRLKADGGSQTQYVERKFSGKTKEKHRGSRWLKTVGGRGGGNWGELRRFSGCD